jgi:hypothetical protein
MRRPPSISVKPAIVTFVSRVHRTFTREKHRKAPDKEVCAGKQQSGYRQCDLNNDILQGDRRNWPAVAGLAIGIRAELAEKASAHQELWERLENLIQNALETRTELHNQRTT